MTQAPVPIATPQPLPTPLLWECPAPVHFDSRWPRWLKYAFAFALLAAAFPLDKTIAAFAIDKTPLPTEGDISRELMMLEQYGQWFSSVLIITAVALIDKKGKPKALGMIFGCLATVLACYLIKDLVGRPRPHVYGPAGAFRWKGPAWGFTKGSAFGAFPSAHTTGSMALAAGLSWLYPRGRALFYFLALQVAAQRILHADHWFSDTVAGAILAITMTRLAFSYNIAGKLIAMAPPAAQRWWLS